MFIRQHFGIDDCNGIRQGFAQIVMIGDDKVHAAGFGVVHGFVGGDAGVAGQDQFCAAVDDLGQLRDVDAVR